VSRRAWVRLDNASNIFLAGRSDVDPKVFRLSAEVDHEVDPRLLQEALDATYDRFRLYHAVLRRGVFWYYLQDSDLRPVVTADDLPTCAPLYHADRRTLLFRVVHHRRRISLEVFHALSDGTGALWFLSALVAAYVRRHDGTGPDPGPHLGPDAATPGDPAAPVAPAAPAVPAVPAGAPDPAEPVHELATDSFAQYFRRRRGRNGSSAASALSTSGAAFRRAAAPAQLLVADTLRSLTGAGPTTERSSARTGPRARVHRIRGRRSPDSRTRAVELTMPAAPVLALARAEGVAITMYLTAVFFEAVHRSSGGLGAARTVSASVPVNLRQFFPSTSARNFFATIRVAHTFGEGPDDLGSICRALEGDFRAKATPQALERKLRRFIRFERVPVLRVMPRPAKDVILGVVNRASNRGLTVAVSNLGRVELPAGIRSQVGRMGFHVSAVRPQLCAISHAGVLTISFTSPYTGTAHVREFARLLTEAGVDVTVAAARVTEEELAEGES
jgi:hypothetical protein